MQQLLEKMHILLMALFISLIGSVLLPGCGGGGGTPGIQTGYVVRELGQVRSATVDINNNGQIVGWSNIGWSDTGIIIWGTDGQTQQIIQDATQDAGYSIGGINDHGAVLGSQPSSNKIFIWSSDSSNPTTISYQLDEEWDSVRLTGFNDLNEIVGYLYALNAYEQTRAVKWDGQTFKLLEIPQEYADSTASDINNHGLIAGNVGNRANSDLDATRAATWDRNGKIKLLDLPASAVSSAAYAVNNFGQSVGVWWDGSGIAHAALWDPNGRVKTMRSLPGYKNSCAADINDSGIIVGNVNNANYIYEYETYQAVLWTPDNRTIPLQHIAGGIGSLANSISNGGVITGNAFTDSNGLYQRGVVWAPKQ